VTEEIAGLIGSERRFKHNDRFPLSMFPSLAGSSAYVLDQRRDVVGVAILLG